VEKRLKDLGRPEYIDHKMFHNLIEDWRYFPEAYVAAADV
jgi:hypothetical protein